VCVCVCVPETKSSQLLCYWLGSWGQRVRGGGLERCRATSWVPPRDEPSWEPQPDDMHAQPSELELLLLRTTIYGPGIPMEKKKTRIEEGCRREEKKKKCRQDCSCMLHLGFRSAAKTIAPLESQMSFHVRGPKAREGHRGGGRTEKPRRRGCLQPSMIFPDNRTVMWRIVAI